MELNVLLRGQSNAQLLLISPGWNDIATTVEQLLGFNGTTDTVNLLANQNQSANDNTVIGGTAFVGDWITPVNGNWRNGWTNNTLETGLLNYINSLPASEKAAPTAIVWLHNEYDSTNPTLTTAEWMSGVQFEAQQVRAALGQPAATAPYVFVNAIPYGSNLIPQINQNMKLGMEQLAADPGFDATVGAQTADTNMDYGQTGYYGGPHMDTADANQTDQRLAVMLAQQFAPYAKPGSAVALGQVDGYGPEAMAAQTVGTDQVLVTTALDHASLSATLSGDAANGLGWQIIDGSQTLDATAAQVTGSDQMLLTFGGNVPSDAGAMLFYAYGYGRLGTGSSDPGQGHAIYDAQQMPIWAPASGVPISDGAAAAGSFTEQNLVTGGVAQVQGTASSVAGYAAELIAVQPDSVAITATMPDAFLVGGQGHDALIATSGNNLLQAGTGATLMIGGTGQDRFAIGAAGATTWDAIDNFHAGDQLMLWGATFGQSQVAWAEDAQGQAVATVTGGGTSAARIGFVDTGLVTAQGYAIAGGSAGGMPYLTITAT